VNRESRPPRARKRFAQHFLVQPGIARRIVALAELGKRDLVLEIGPGRGALTSILAEAASDLWLIEVDRDLCRQLQEKFASQRNVHLIEGDVLKVDLDELLPSLGSAVVIANLPYNISTPVLMRLLDQPDRFRRLVLMLQREVADRLTASPGTKTYGALSVMVQLVATTSTGFTVQPSAFSPRPKVESAVVVVDPHKPSPLPQMKLKKVRAVVRTAFSQRRKQLGNALSPLTPNARKVLRRIGIDPQRRPETLTVEEFVAVATALEQGP